LAAAAGVYHGREGLLRAFRGITEVVEDLRGDPEKFFDLRQYTDTSQAAPPNPR
jgi:hypothetical protein